MTHWFMFLRENIKKNPHFIKFSIFQAFKASHTQNLSSYTHLFNLAAPAASGYNNRKTEHNQQKQHYIAVLEPSNAKPKT